MPSHDDLFKWFGRAFIIPLVLTSIGYVAYTLKQHGEALSSIATSIEFIKHSQDDMKIALSSQLGPVIEVENDINKKIAALDQAEIDTTAKLDELQRMSLPSPEYRRYYSTPQANPLEPLFKQLEKLGGEVHRRGGGIRH